MHNAKEIISDWFYDYSQDVFNFLVYYTGTTDVEDLVQEVFIKAGRGLASYQNQGSPKTWLFSIARNLAIDKTRKKDTVFNRSAEPLHDTTMSQQTGASPEQILIDHEDKQDLYRLINQQKKKFRDVLILRGIQGLTVRETAEILGCRETAVRTNYHRAIQALQSEHTWRGSHER